MEVSILELSIVQAKINNNEKPEGFFNRIRYDFSKYNSIQTPQKINRLVMELIQEKVDAEETSNCIIPREYEKLFKLYLKK